MKKNKKVIVPIVVILAVVILIIIIVLIKKNADNSKVNMAVSVGASDAKAQVYSATKTPTLKDDDKIFGSKDAAVKIFVYEDSDSNYSAKLADTLDKIYSEKSGDIAIIVRPFITTGSLNSKAGALAVECAGDQNKWIAMRALLFSKAKNGGLNLGKLNEYATQVGLDENAFSACLTNQTKSAKIEGLSSEAEGYDVIGAPTIFIGDELIIGARPYEDYVDSSGDKIEGLKTIVDRKLK